MKTRNEEIKAGKDIDKLVNDEMKKSIYNTEFNKYRDYIGANPLEGRYEDMYFDTKEEKNEYLKRKK